MLYFRLLWQCIIFLYLVATPFYGFTTSFMLLDFCMPPFAYMIRSAHGTNFSGSISTYSTYVFSMSSFTDLFRSIGSDSTLRPETERIVLSLVCSGFSDGIEILWRPNISSYAYGSWVITVYGDAGCAGSVLADS